MIFMQPLALKLLLIMQIGCVFCPKRMNPSSFLNLPNVSRWIQLWREPLDPFSTVLYSTKADEFAAVQTLVDQGFSLKDAIRKVSAQSSVRCPVSGVKKGEGKE